MTAYRGERRLADAMLGVAVLGSLWGVSEVVLGSLLRMAGVPFRSGILTGIGVGLLAVALGALQRPVLLAVIPVVAVLCKQLVVPILGVSVLCKANSCLAVMLEGLAVTAVASLAWRRLERRPLLGAAAGAGAALLAAGVFYVAGLRLAPCNYLQSFQQAGGLIAFLGAEGVPWAAFSALLFPAGHWIGGRLRSGVLARERRPLAYYIAASALVIGSWAGSAAAILAGF